MSRFAVMELVAEELLVEVDGPSMVLDLLQARVRREGHVPTGDITIAVLDGNLVMADAPDGYVVVRAEFSVEEQPEVDAATE